MVPIVNLKGFADKAERVKLAAAELTARIVSFEGVISALPGRVEMRMGFGRDVADAGQMSLIAGRSGKSWRLTYEVGMSAAKPLVDAPLKIKLAAVAAFPDLLFNMEMAQDDLVKKLEAAVKEYDWFVKESGL